MISNLRSWKPDDYFLLKLWGEVCKIWPLRSFEPFWYSRTFLKKKIVKGGVKKFQALQQNHWIKIHTSENNFSISNDIFNVIWNLQHEMSCWCSCKSCGFVSGWFKVISQTDGFRFWAWTTELSSVWTSGWGHISGSHDNITSKTTEINSRVCSIFAGPSLRFGPDNFYSSK